MVQPTIGAKKIDEVAILQRKILGLGIEDTAEWEIVAFTTSMEEIQKWIKGAHMYERRKTQYVKRKA